MKANSNEKIIKEYSNLMIEVNKPEYLLIYPLVYPKSLLKHSKDDIKKALVVNGIVAKDDEYSEVAKYCISFLDRFVDDDEAKKKNEELLNSKEYKKTAVKYLDKHIHN